MGYSSLCNTTFAINIVTWYSPHVLEMSPDTQTHTISKFGSCKTLIKHHQKGRGMFFLVLNHNLLYCGTVSETEKDCFNMHSSKDNRHTLDEINVTVNRQ